MTENIKKIRVENTFFLPSYGVSKKSMKYALFRWYYGVLRVFCPFLHHFNYFLPFFVLHVFEEAVLIR